MQLPSNLLEIQLNSSSVQTAIEVVLDEIIGAYVPVKANLEIGPEGPMIQVTSTSELSTPRPRVFKSLKLESKGGCWDAEKEVYRIPMIYVYTNINDESGEIPIVEIRVNSRGTYHSNSNDGEIV
jgi:hypothetical protein